LPDKFEAEAQSKTMQMAAIPEGWRILDNGPETVAAFSK
jgi:phosphoglycerate kinase